MKQKKRQQIMHSTIFRICAVIILLILPINILTLVLSTMTVNKSREQISAETQNTLDMSMNNFDSMITRAEKKLTYLSFGNSDFVAMAQADVSENGQVATLIQNTKEKLKEASIDYPWIDTIYFYFPLSDYYVSYGSGVLEVKAGREKVTSLSGAAALSHTWNVMEVGGKSALLYRNVWKGSEYGGIISLDGLLRNMGLGQDQPGRIVYFTNQDRSIMSRNVTNFLEENHMSLTELEDGKEYTVFETALEDSDLILVEAVKSRELFSNLPGLVSLLQISSVVLTVLAIPLLLFFMRRWIIYPLNRLTNAMERIEQGDTKYRIAIQREGTEFEQINKNFNNMMDQVEQLKNDVYETKLQRKSIKLRYLSQQIQPHFILNAMNIIYSYEPEEYPLIQKMVLCLSKYFRYIVKVNAEFVLLKHEMEHIKNYFEIQKARYPDLFFAIVEYEEELENALVPPLLVQNFAENAVKHSLKIGNRIKIFVVGERLEDKLRIRLADTGEGISEEMLDKIEKFRETGVYQEGLGIGIQNAIERLEYLYKGKTSFRIWRDENYTGTNVEIILPLYFSDEEVGEGYYEDIIS